MKNKFRETVFSIAFYSFLCLHPRTVWVDPCLTGAVAPLVHLRVLHLLNMLLFLALGTETELT